MRSLAITQTGIKNQQLRLVWKLITQRSKIIKIIMIKIIIHMDHLILARRQDLIIFKKKKKEKKKRTCKIVDFAVLADHRIKLKECEKKDTYLNLARELKKLWNVLVTIIPIVIGAFETVTKGTGRTWKLADEERPSKLLHYWKQPEYWEESGRLEKTCCHSNSSERPLVNADVKNSNEKIMIIIIITIIIIIILVGCALQPINPF